MLTDLQLADLSLESPALNLALDEALLEHCDATDAAGGVLRFWHTPTYFVVVGYGNRVATEVEVAACVAAGIPVLRRCSGGGTVLQGPGCLNYALVLPVADSGPLASITGTNEFVMQRNWEAVSGLVDKPVRIEGHTDLAVAGRKFSGNSQRRRRRYLLFHGTFLLRFDVGLLERVLRPPTREPAYRHGRRHGDFVMNLPVAEGDLRAALRRVWGAQRELENPPLELTRELVAGRYGNKAWNLRL